MSHWLGCVRKGDPDFLNWLNNFLRQIKGDGTYDKIYAKWFESSDWQKDPEGNAK